MTVKELKKIIRNLSDDTHLIISADDIYDVETIIIEHHADGRTHLILSVEE